MEASFVESWSRVTELLRRRASSLGSRLHRGNDGIWYGYAQWPNAEATAARVFPATRPRASAQMRAAIAESLPEILLEPVADYLVLPNAIDA